MKHLKLVGIISIGLGVDLLSKHFFYNLNYFNQSNLIESVLNQGISRSLPVPFFLILIVSVIGIGAIFRLYKTKYIGHFITGLLLAGTLGNFIDRLIFGGVRDFINIGFFNFPIFNIADIMLTVGVGLRMLQVILEKKK